MKNLKAILITATLVVTAVALANANDAPAPTTPPPAPRAPVYVVEYDIGPAYLQGRPFAEQPGLDEHGRYMNQLTTEGVLVWGGPTFDDLESFTVSGALLFVNVATEAEALRILEKDPAISHGLMTIVGVKPFMVMIGEY
jgi:uncharacterized protein YciI